MCVSAERKGKGNFFLVQGTFVAYETSAGLFPTDYLRPEFGTFAFVEHQELPELQVMSSIHIGMHANIALLESVFARSPMPTQSKLPIALPHVAVESESPTIPVTSVGILGRMARGLGMGGNKCSGCEVNDKNCTVFGEDT